MPGTMVIQRQPEQIVFMLGQGLSIDLFDMNRKLLDPAAHPATRITASEIMPPGVWVQRNSCREIPMPPAIGLCSESTC
jgi:hypothetical protein